MARTKLTVTTDVGTFTRETERTYSHIVLVKDERFEVLEAERRAHIASNLRYAAAYEAGTDGQGQPMTPKHIADGSRDRWVTEYRQEAAQLDAAGPVTVDKPTDWHVANWCGRRDLAETAADAEQLTRYRHVRIYEVATGHAIITRNRAEATPEAIAAHWAARDQARRRRSHRRRW